VSQQGWANEERHERQARIAGLHELSNPFDDEGPRFVSDTALLPEQPEAGKVGDGDVRSSRWFFFVHPPAGSKPGG
jgi:hypothetical protein